MEKKDFAPLSDLLHKDLDFKGSLGSQHNGLESFKFYVQLIHSAQEDYQCIIKETVIQPEKAFAKMQFRGKHIGNLLRSPQRSVPFASTARPYFTSKEQKSKRFGYWVM